MFRRTKRYSKAFTLVEMLLSLLICCCITTNIASILSIAKNLNDVSNSQTSLEAGALQISRLLYAKEIISIGDELVYMDEDQEFTLSFNNSRLVKQPGYTIYQEDIQDVSFFQEGYRIYMEITLEDQKTVFWIGVYVENESEEQGDDTTSSVSAIFSDQYDVSGICECGSLSSIFLSKKSRI
ncbi:hypothetical protein [Tannockella kyphosi]|uniref:hypothetical protein n=1 Tax=Tannockella kyphosi TaxID=2899121 RepID=UPI0020128A56|nr:hypothetical protein [Tannockella kyphosi]